MKKTRRIQYLRGPNGGMTRDVGEAEAAQAIAAGEAKAVEQPAPSAAPKPA